MRFEKMQKGQCIKKGLNSCPMALTSSALSIKLNKWQIFLSKNPRNSDSLTLEFHSQCENAFFKILRELSFFQTFSNTLKVSAWF